MLSIQLSTIMLSESTVIVVSWLLCASFAEAARYVGCHSVWPTRAALAKVWVGGIIFGLLGLY